MSRLISLNARMAQEDQSSDEIEVALFKLTHPLLDTPIRLSTDNTERLQDDPILYGTRSTWGDANPITDPYLFVVASAIFPDDKEDAPASASIVLDNLDAEMVELLRSFTTPASLSLAMVLASTPDLVEFEFSGLHLASADIDAGSITLSFSRDEIELEPFPSGRMTRRRFPGMHA